MSGPASRHGTEAVVRLVAAGLGTIVAGPLGAALGGSVGGILGEHAAKLVEKFAESGFESLKDFGVHYCFHQFQHLGESHPKLEEAVRQALREALWQVRPFDATDTFESWFKNWDARLSAPVQLASLATTLTEAGIAAAPEQVLDDLLRDTMQRLDGEERGASSKTPTLAPYRPMPADLLDLLKAHLPGPFDHAFRAQAPENSHVWFEIEQGFQSYVREKLSSIERQLEKLIAREGRQSRSVSHRLSGFQDYRLQPMRGFFTGREEQIRQVLELLRGSGRLAVVTGTLYNIQGGPGIGKTELCKAALRQFLQESPECRAIFVDVTGVRGIDALLDGLAKAVGDKDLAKDSDALMNALAEGADLIYLDNLEDALPEEDPSAGPVFEYLEALARLRPKVLASSRRRLGSLAQEVRLDTLSPPEAQTLFDHFWRGVKPYTDPEGLSRFIERDLACHALTIRLLAAQSGESHTWQTWQQLRESWMKSRSRIAVDTARRDRASNLDLSISLTFEQARKSPAAAELWIAMACFPEGMSAAAQQVLLRDEDVLRQAATRLDRLGAIDRDEGRLEMLAPLRQFAAGLDPTVTLPVWARCLQYFHTLALLAKSTERGGGERRAGTLRALAVEFPNLSECLYLAIEKNLSSDLVERIHSALFNSYQFNAVLARELLRRLDTYFAAQLRTGARANTLLALGDLERRLGDVAGARRRYEEALKLYEAEQDNLGRANTLRSLGELERRLGDLAGARRRYEEALKLYEAEQANLGRANTLQSLGDLERRLGDLAGARRRYEEALKLYEAEQANLGRANTLQSLGDLERRLGDLAGARRRYEEALTLYEAQQANLGRANTLRSLGDLERRLGDLAGARRRYEEALKLYEAEQDNLGRANTLRSLGELERRLGDVSGARRRYEEALKLYEAEQDNLGRANTLRSLGDLDLASGDVQQGVQRFAAALRFYEAEQETQGQALTLARLAVVRAFEERQDAAELAALARAAARAANSPPVIDHVDRMLTAAGL